MVLLSVQYRCISNRKRISTKRKFTILPNDSIEGNVIVRDKNWDYLNKHYDKYLVTIPFSPDQLTV